MGEAIQIDSDVYEYYFLHRLPNPCREQYIFVHLLFMEFKGKKFRIMEIIYVKILSFMSAQL